MELLTESLREQLLANAMNRDRDHVPVVKFFHPCGAPTWLILASGRRRWAIRA